MRLAAASLLALVLVPAAVAEAAPPRIGVLALDSSPTYGGTVAAHWTFARRPQLPAMGVICYQDAARYIAELPVSRDLSGSGSVTLANETSSAMPGSLDYALPAHCQVWMFDDHRGGQQGEIITNVVGFDVAQEDQP